MVRRPQFAPVAIVLAAVALIGAGVFILIGGPGQSPAPAVRVNFQPPSREVLDRAITKGTRAFLQDYVQPAADQSLNGGYVDYTDALGQTKRYGPNVYVACNIYLLTHFLMYQKEFRVPDDDPLLAKVREWLVSQFDSREGRWIWSEEGCLHPKGMMALARQGRPDLIDAAWRWARQSPMWLPQHTMFTMMQSGNIIQTLGNAKISLTGKHDWEHGSPIPDAENSSKFLHAMLGGGHSLSDPEVAELNDGINRYFETNPLTFDQMHTRDVIGMIWYVFCHHDFNLPKRGGYRFCVETMTRAAGQGGLLQRHALTEHFISVRGMVARALMRAGVETPAIVEQVNIALNRQTDSGSWPLTPAGRQAWNLNQRPAVGLKMGQMDGANTYLTALTLIDYRDHVYGRQAGAGR